MYISCIDKWYQTWKMYISCIDKSYQPRQMYVSCINKWCQSRQMYVSCSDKWYQYSNHLAMVTTGNVILTFFMHRVLNIWWLCERYSSPFFIWNGNLIPFFVLPLFTHRWLCLSMKFKHSYFFQRGFPWFRYI